MESNGNIMYDDGRKITNLEFRFGPVGSAIPMLFFIVWAIVCSFKNIANEQSLIIGAVIGLGLGLLICKSSAEKYLKAVTEGMTQSVAAVAIIAWFWAGIFAAVLQVGGLVDGLVWAGVSTGVSGSVFTVLTFILAALFGTAVGTGYGTLVAFTMLMYPAGVLMGSHPLVLLGAILSGSAFGDNLAPVSDTTIISAATQDTDIMGVVRTRFKYSIVAAFFAIILFFIFGSSKTGVIADANSLEMINEYINPKGLLLLFPFALVLLLAFRGKNLIVSISWGIVTAIIIILVAGFGTMEDILWFDVSNGTLVGAVVDGVSGYLHMCVLLLLIMSCGYLITAGNLMRLMEEAILKKVGSSVKKAELAIWTIVSILNALMSVNAAAEITAAPFVKSIGKRFNIHPYRRANMLDAITAAGGFILPWSGGVLLATTVVNGMLDKYPFLTSVTPGEIWYLAFHGWILVLVMLFAALTSWDLKYIGEDGKPSKVNSKKELCK
ncbi:MULTISPECIES: Na+/H+ antiporter NhaC family protein [unclassified Sedimentibacter]|uniref:Na+/H+ antiporter NhaC family protein n=1 Tax=unclassified Sedimentibacter TaxID=2649220 RepID=UPI0027DFF652|nr:Na+/H+ antiporter NhaC family protein [Sedimentibacter sp. MB35-C1]WMJ77089.1 Na+/H+ antiporter NhaC family protein [Sedimentibacter sp. MB35-C1]